MTPAGGSDDSIDHLDWELDEGWAPITPLMADLSEDEFIGYGIVQGGWGTVTHFQIVPGSLSVVIDDPPARVNWNAVMGYAVMLAMSIPVWLLAGYGLYCLVRR